MSIKEQESTILQAPSKKKVIRASLLNPVSDQQVDLLPDTLLVLTPSADDTGDKIELMGNEEELASYLHPKSEYQIVDLRNYILIPGLIDLHFHWVQDAVRSAPKESLLEWLKNHTWPTEAKFADLDYSQLSAAKFSAELIKNGTMAGCCYSSIHDHTIDHIKNSFVGDFIVGTVIMTINSPDYLTQDPDEVIRVVTKRCQQLQAEYAVTPRFAPTVDPATLTAIGESAMKNGSFIQTHLAETKDEIDYVLSIFRQFPLFSDVNSYTDIYHRCKLLTPKTIMGHAIHLDESEWQLLAQTGTAIAHCPTSNAPLKELGLGSGLFNYQMADHYNIKWGLASDIGAGPHLSMFDVIRSFVEQNRRAGLNPTYTQGLFRSTLASAEIMGQKDLLGSFAPGKWANWLMLSGPNLNSKLDGEGVLSSLIGNKQQSRSDFYQLIQGRYYRGKMIG
ncbi:MAG: amidohydrolase family protein [Bdellovibrionales bacterium]|nr:amidohydrolase family protein [Bdellovibrionales bacterium]MBT3526940.1 amidohydrolase family protein [Bdellovibrionales bacterium]